MARGWESKSVEAQQEEAATGPSPAKPHLTREEAARHRQIGGLQLSLQSALHQLERSTNVRRRAMLEQAIADLERKLQMLEL